LYAFAVMAYVLLVQERLEHVGGMMAGCFLYLGTDLSFVVAGNLFWRSKLRPAIIAIGIAGLGVVSRYKPSAKLIPKTHSHYATQPQSNQTKATRFCPASVGNGIFL
jgi:hypothetical protein